MSTRAQSSLTFVALPMLATLGLVALLYALTVWRVSGGLQERGALGLEQRAQLLADRLQAELSARADALEQLARSDALADGAPPARARAELAWLRDRSPGLVWVGLADAEGLVRVGSEGWLEGESIATRPVFRDAREARLIGDIHPPVRLAPLLARAGRDTRSVIDIGVPLRGADGRLRGVLAAHIDAAVLLALGDGQIGARERDGSGLGWHLVADDGQVLGPPLPVPLAALAGAAADGPARLVGGGSAGRWLVAAQRLRWSSPDGGTPWRVVLSQREAAVLQPLRDLERSLAWFALLALGAAGLGGLIVARRLAQPIDALLDRLVAQMPGLATSSGRENFAAHLRRLQAALPPLPGAAPHAAALLVGRLVRDADRLQRVVDSLPVGVALLSRRGRVVDANEPLRRLLGAALVGEALEGRIVEAGPRAVVAWHFEAAAGLGSAGLAGLHQCSLRHDDGRVVPVALQWLPMTRASAPGGGSADGTGDATLLVVQDLSATAAAAAQAQALAARLAAFVEAALDYAFATLDEHAQVIDWSPGAEALTGRGHALQRGTAFETLFEAGVRASGLPARLLQEANAAGRAALLARLQRADGSAFVADGVLYAFRAGAGGTAYALVFADATRAQAAARRIAESEERLAAVIGGASDAVISTDAEGRVQLFNPAAERIFGRPAAAMLGQPLDVLLPAGHGDGHRASMAGFAASQATKRPMGVGRVQGLRADGAVLELEASISRAVVGGRTVLTAILRDVTERMRAERALVEYQRQLAGLTQRLLEQEKLTTQRLAQALHDDLGQTLAAQRWLFEAAQARETLPPWAQKLQALVLQANQQVRHVLTELRPPLLDEQGLLAALDNELANRRALQADDAPRLLLDTAALPEGLRWPPDVEYAAFMVAREAVGNALRHAAARQVRVVLEGGPGALQLAVHDDGRGTPALPEALHPGHLGLVGMRERALAIGATLDIRSAEATGTTVRLAWRDTASARIAP